MPPLKLGPWRPDMPPDTPGIVLAAEGVIPQAGGYQPIYEPIKQADAVPARVLGAVAARDLAGGVHVFAGTDEALYELDAGTWVDRSKSGGYTSTDTANWAFTPFEDRMIASNGEDAIQYFDMSSAAPDFADLPNAPRARLITTFRDFVVLGDTEDATYEVRWSGFRDTEEWTVGTSQSDLQRFADGGRVTGLLPTDVLYVVQEYAIRRGTYVGSPFIIAFDRVELARGCIEPRSVVALGSRCFYLSEDGFYSFDPGGGSTPIGAGKIDEWFKRDFARGYAYRMTGAADPVNKVVVWSYASVNSTFGQPDTLLSYSWVTGEWSMTRLNVSCIVPALTTGYALEDLDDIYPDIDEMSISLDDPVLTGGALRFASFNTLNELSWFAGAPLAAKIETGVFQPNPGGRTKIVGARIHSDAANAILQVGVAERSSDGIVWKPESTQRASGRCGLRGTGRWAQLRLTVPAGETWTYASAIDLDGMREAGWR